MIAHLLPFTSFHASLELFKVHGTLLKSNKLTSHRSLVKRLAMRGSTSTNIDLDTTEIPHKFATALL